MTSADFFACPNTWTRRPPSVSQIPFKFTPAESTSLNFCTLRTLVCCATLSVQRCLLFSFCFPKNRDRLSVQTLAVSLTSVHTSRYTTLRLAKLRAVTPALQGLSPVGFLLLKELYLTFKAHTSHYYNTIFLLFFFIFR